MNRYSWTKSAKECYFRNCHCNGCEVYKMLGRHCRMKQTVIELVRELGVPKSKEDNNEQIQL